MRKKSSKTWNHFIESSSHEWEKKLSKTQNHFIESSSYEWEKKLSIIRNCFIESSLYEWEKKLSKIQNCFIKSSSHEWEKKFIKNPEPFYSVTCLVGLGQPRARPPVAVDARVGASPRVWGHESYLCELTDNIWN